MFSLSLKKILFTALVFPFAAGAITFTPAAQAAENFVPAHTLESQARAYDMAERIDETVVMTKDGRLVVLPDFFLDTTTDVASKFHGRTRADGRYYACDFTLNEIKTLRVVGRFNPITHEPVNHISAEDGMAYSVPSLDEMLTQVQELNRASGRGVSVRINVAQPAFFANEGLDIVTAAIDTMTVFGYNIRSSKASLIIQDDTAAERSVQMGWKGGLVTASSLGSPAVQRAREILSASLAAPQSLEQE